MDDGLPSDKVTALLFDSHGFLWVGTGSGLSRFDGVDFRSYLPDPLDSLSISHHHVVHVSEDRSGNLWISIFNGGLCRMNPHTEDFRCFPLLGPSGMGESASQSVYQSQPDRTVDHVVWAATDNGLVRLDESTSEARLLGPDRTDPSLATCEPTRGTCPLVRSLYQDTLGRVWFGAKGMPIGRFDPSTNRIQTFLHPAEAGESSYALFLNELPSQPGVLWAGMYAGGLWQVDMTSGEARLFDHVGPTGMVFSAFEDSSGRIWLASDGGLVRWNASRIEPERVPLPSPMDPGTTIRPIAEDPSGQLWLGSWTNGLFALDLARTEAVRFHSREGDVRVFAEVDPGLLLLGEQDRIVGTTARGADFLRLELPGLNPLGMLVDADGDLWISTRDWGVLRIHLDRPIAALAGEAGSGPWSATWREAGAPCLSDPPPSRVTQDVHQLATSRGRLAGEVRHFQSSEWTRDASIRSLERGTELRRRFETQYAGIRHLGADETDPDVIWLSHQYGIAAIRRSSNVVTPIRQIQAESERGAYQTLGTIHGRLWVAAQSGLLVANGSASQLDPYRARYVGRRSPTLVGILHVRSHPKRPFMLVLGTTDGLALLDTVTGSAEWVRGGSRSFFPYPVVAMAVEPDGPIWAGRRFVAGRAGMDLLRLDPETGSLTRLDLDRALDPIFVDSRRHLLVGALGGYYEVRPELIRRDLLPPALHVTYVEPAQSPVGPSGRTSSRSMWTGNEIRLLPGQRDLRIEYVGLHFRDPEDTVYSYRLDGYDGQWRDVGPERVARYTNLGPGDYTFMLKAANADGVWNESPLAIPVVVMAPWWRTRTAMILYVLLVVAGLVLAERTRHWSIVRRERQRAALRESRIRSEVAEERARQKEEHASRLAELNEARSRFLANVSHEFRTPLTLILGVSEDAERGRLGSMAESARRGIGTIVRSARRVDGLVRQLLDLSRLESGSMKLEVVPGDITQMVRDVVRAHAALAERAGVSLGVECMPAVVRMTFDPPRLRTALGNLLANAVKYTEPGGEITVTVRADLAADAPLVRIAVTDTGIGIAPEDLERIFERFEQASPPVSRGLEGLGIGLAMARELVQLHDGQLQVQSEPGAGSEFSIMLPAPGLEVLDAEPCLASGAAADPDQTAGPDAASSPNEAEAPGSIAYRPDRPQRPVALIVDDNADVRRFLEDHFENDFLVILAADGREALEAAARTVPDIVVTDIRMPVMDGIALCRAIRNDDDLRDIPIIIVTARAGEESAIEGLRAGADEYVTKPFSAALLIQTALNLVASRARMREDFGQRVVFDSSGMDVESRDDALLRRVLEVANEHLAETGFTLDDLADHVGISLRHLERKLPEVCGESPSELIRRMRFERACQLLMADVGTVSEIAYAVGYRSHSHFSAAFRAIYGTSPSEYREANGRD